MQKTIAFLQKYGIYLVLLLAIGLVTFSLIKTRPTKDLTLISKQVESELQSRESKLIEEIEDKEKIGSWLSQLGFIKNYETSTEYDVEDIFDYDFTVGIYRDDTLVFWNNNKTNLSLRFSSINDENNGKFVKQKNGYYLRRSQRFEFGGSEYIVKGLSLIKYNFPVESNYLKNLFFSGKEGFLGLERIPNEVYISEEPTSYPIKSISDEYLFYLDASEAFTSTRSSFFQMLSFLFFTIVLLQLSNRWGIALVNRYNALVGFSFVAAVAVLIWSIYYSNWISQKLTQIGLFAIQEDYAIFTKSIGHFLINVICIFWLAIFFHKHFISTTIKNTSTFSKYVFSLLSYLSVFGGIIFITLVLESLVIDSGVAFNFENISLLDWVSISSLIGFMLLLVGLFLYTYRVSRIIVFEGLTLKSRVACILIANVVMLPLMILFGIDVPLLQISLFSIIFILSFDVFVENNKTNFGWLVIWLVINSGFISALMYNYNVKANHLSKTQLAEYLLLEKDSSIINALQSAGYDIQEDPSIINLVTLQKNETEIRQTINNNHLLDIVLYEFVINVEVDSLTDSLVRGTKSPSVIYQDNQDALNQYIVNIPMEEGKTLRLKFSRRLEEDTDVVYSELYLNEKIKKINKILEFDFAIYKNKKLIVSNNPDNHLATSDLKKPITKDKANHSISYNNGFEYLRYFGEGSTHVEIRSKQFSFYQRFLSMFSFLFTVMIILIIILIGINSLFKVLPTNLEISFIPNPSLRNRVQFAIITVIVMTFIVVGVVTIIFSDNNTRVYHEKRLSRKAQSITGQTYREINQLNISTPEEAETKLPEIVEAIADIHRLDLIFYNLEGRLITSSRQSIFDKGLISRLMPGQAYFGLHHLENEIVGIDNEVVGTFSFDSHFEVVYNKNNEPIAYCGIPYYAEKGKLRSTTSELMGALLNVYVFLLLLSGAIAIFIANSITRPITVIGEKIKQLKLDSTNDPIAWKSNDELGQLIKEYNKMLEKLDNSAKLLAQSEREGAWREMAKQVAHEIKNPLTPMKLSIQYLQHAMKSNPESAQSMLDRVSKTLIQQIDNLSHIATEFSNFAKMPTANNAVFVLNDLIESVCDLFYETENVMFYINITEENCVVYADENQLMRVFNNLIKNAIQAIPDEREGNIVVTLEKIENIAKVTVKDNGSGIPEEKRDYVFVPNFTTKSSGTGLGLAISKSIVETLGGAIYFETRNNIGTTFYVDIPTYEGTEEID